MNDGPFTLVMDSAERAGQRRPRRLTRASIGLEGAGQTFCGGPAAAAAGLDLRDRRPSVTTVIGCRFGSQRRSARFRFIPTDCGFQPVIGFLPQMSQSRAMVEESSNHEGTGAMRAGAIGMRSTLRSAHAIERGRS